MSRIANTNVDRQCNSCPTFMIGIMKHSDKDGYTAPRTHCVDCINEMEHEASHQDFVEYQGGLIHGN